MPAFWGSPTGPYYPLGLITVATAGTPVPLSQNVSLNQPTGGPGTQSTPITAKKIWVHASAANTGVFVLVFKGGNQSITPSIVLVVEPGRTEELVVDFLGHAPILPSGFNADASANGAAAWVVLVV